MRRSNLVFNLLQIIFTLVGAGMLVAGYFSAPGSLTGDGYPLNYFFYGMGTFFIVWPIILFGTIKFFYRRSAQKVTYLREHGIKGKARVLNMRRTGVSINRVPQVILDLDITTDLGEQILVPYKKCIDPIYYTLIKPDADLTVLINPTNKKEVYVDFEAEWARLAGRRGSSGFS